MLSPKRHSVKGTPHWLVLPKEGHLVCMCVQVYIHAYACHSKRVEVRDQLVRVRSLILPCSSQDHTQVIRLGVKTKAERWSNLITLAPPGPVTVP